MALATAVFAAPPPVDPTEQPDQADTPQNQHGGAVAAPGTPVGGADAAANKKKPAMLTVVVTGGGQPIKLAEVVVKFPGATSDENRLKTNPLGEATFKCECSGMAKVRVIADGWTSLLKDVPVAAGSQQVTIVLQPLADDQ